MFTTKREAFGYAANFILKVACIVTLAAIIAYSLCGENAMSQSPEATLGCNFVNLDEYGTVAAMQKVIDATPVNGTILCRLRTDKVQSDVLDLATINKAITFDSLCKLSIRNFKVTYTVNLWASTSVNTTGISMLKNKSVVIDYVELGNEYYSIVEPKLSFPVYRTTIQPQISAIRQAFPDLKFALPAAPNPMYNGFPGRNDHTIWNDSLSKFITTLRTTDAIVWHIYYNSTVAPQIGRYEKGLAKQTYSKSVYNEYLDTIYTSIFTLCTASELWSTVNSYCNFKFPGRTVILTEVGIDNSGKFRNTWAYSAVLFRDLARGRATFDEIYIHAGISIVGIIDKDGNTTVEYFAYKLADKLPVNVVCVDDAGELKEGVNTFYFVNGDEARTPQFTVPSGYAISSTTKEYIKGNFIYSTGGVTDWMNNFSDKTPEITGTITDSEQTLPQYSFGIISITVYKTVVPECRRKMLFFCFKAKRGCNC